LLYVLEYIPQARNTGRANATASTLNHSAPYKRKEGIDGCVRQRAIIDTPHQYPKKRITKSILMRDQKRIELWVRILGPRAMHNVPPPHPALVAISHAAIVAT
jgi:hypothetical protein